MVLRPFRPVSQRFGSNLLFLGISPRSCELQLGELSHVLIHAFIHPLTHLFSVIFRAPGSVPGTVLRGGDIR